MAAFGVLAEAHTYTWRSPEVMLSSVVDHRFGDKRDQAHAWQATIDPDALVFTTHPARPTPESLDGATTRTTGPARRRCRGARSTTTSRSTSTRRATTRRPIRCSARCSATSNETHAYFPQDHFDEVVQRDGWTFGRKGDGYVALWSMRPTTWRSYDPTVVATRGSSSRSTWSPRAAPATSGWSRSPAGPTPATSPRSSTPWPSAPIEAELTGGTHRVRYRSPSQGEIELSTGGGLRVDGTASGLADHDRLESPWGDVCYLGRFLTLALGDRSLVVDFDTGAREIT